MPRFHQLFILALAGCALPLAAAQAAPPTPAAVGVQGRATLSSAELDHIRGGFTVEGITFGFGADIRTYVDGKLALQTQLTWTDKGAVTSTTHGDLGSPLSTNAGANGLSLAGLKGADGVVIPGDNGATAVAQRVTADQIQNLVVNTASNRDIRQDVQLNLAIPELAKMQSNFANQQASMRLDQGMLGSALSSLRR